MVRNLNINGDVTVEDGGNSSGGIEGMLAGESNGTVVRVNTSGTVDVDDFTQDITTAGGLVGVNRGTILRSSSSVATAGGGSAGGLVGENFGVIAQSYASGPVYMVGGVLGNINGSPGGLVGFNSGTITQSYATGAVPQGCGFGGFCIGGAALVSANTGTISESFATGSTPLGAGIAGSNSGTIANNVYWDKDTTGDASGVGSGTPLPASNGLTTAQMSNPASFAGWNFAPGGDWVMPAGATHPVLAWQVGHPGSH